MREFFAIAGHAMLLPGGLQWASLRDGRSAVRELEGEAPVPMGAPVEARFEPPPDWPHAFFPRALGMALAVLADLPLDPARRYGLILGMPNMYSEPAYMDHTLVHRDDPEEMGRLLGFSGDLPLHFIAKRLKLTGPLLRVDAACATGNDALIAAHQWLAAGAVDDVVVLAASSMLNPVGLALFHNLKALNPNRDPEASCPFDVRRRGFVMGEGAAAMWLARDPPGPPAGFLCGYGSTMNAHGFVDLPDDLHAMEVACRRALGSLGEVAYVSAHGTATPRNDLCETRLHHRVFGDRAREVPLSSIKSMIGHTLGAAALIEAIVCLNVLREQTAPPTINLNEPDPACDLDYVAHRPREIQGNFALSNAFAFGGHNSCILLAGGLP